MGYTTDFTGSVAVEPALNPEEVSYLKDFAGSRRMTRTRGPLYAHPGADFGQSETADVIVDAPDAGQPGLWCQWVPTDDGTEIEWDGNEKFYESPEWMKWLIQNLLAPSAREFVTFHLSEDPRLAAFTFDHVVNGVIEAQGESPDDRWNLLVVDNVVAVSESDGHVFHKPQPL